MNFKKMLKKITPGFALISYHWCLAFFGALMYGFPSRKLIVIGVTGTSGKSTTVDFIARILEEAGYKVASTSSIRFKVGQKEWQNKMKMTMPGRFVIQKILRQAVDEGCQYAVLEVTSEGIKQFRHKFINFHTAVFLNLTPEHLDAHGGFENYRNAKLELFKVAKSLHIINADDKNSRYFLELSANKKITFGLNKSSNIVAGDMSYKSGKISFFVDTIEFQLDLLGAFNVYNALAAIAVGAVHGVSLQTCSYALRRVVSMSGRLEVVNDDPLVVVDYAFTPEQLKASYESVKTFSGQKSLVCVLGACGGGRDKWKRPVLGKIASQNCREIIVTNEDPYDEDPWEIMEQVASGIDASRDEYHLILDRREAIKKALTLASSTDAVIVTGKGAEPLMCLANGEKVSWDDREVVRAELEKVNLEHKLRK
jgi:UDP-N-acetylmuramoyl-L-alanyl-D-glutamate--2,6-diaminopimelate ligase